LACALQAWTVGQPGLAPEFLSEIDEPSSRQGSGVAERNAERDGRLRIGEPPKRNAWIP
jgi:hypothetical protein